MTTTILAVVDGFGDDVINDTPITPLIGFVFIVAIVAWCWWKDNKRQKELIGQERDEIWHREFRQKLNDEKIAEAVKMFGGRKLLPHEEL